MPKSVKVKSEISSEAGASSGSNTGTPEHAPPFLPLEETMQDGVSEKAGDLLINKARSNVATILSRVPKIGGKKVIWAVIGIFFLTIIWESFFVRPEDRLIQSDFSDKFLQWVEANPGWGLGAITIVIAGAVVSMIPVGTPLTLGCGYIYRGVYGWQLGLFVATAVSMAGSCLGAVVCFLLGRYLMKETVQRWVRNYPLFDAIDVGTVTGVGAGSWPPTSDKIGLGTIILALAH